MNAGLLTVAVGSQVARDNKLQLSHDLSMTSTTSLFQCPRADVTLDRVRDLVGQRLPESLTLEYKQGNSRGLSDRTSARLSLRRRCASL